MTEAIQPTPLPEERVTARPGAGGVARTRRRIYQRHLLLLLAVGGGLVALDLYTSPALSFAHFLIFPWALVFLLHSVALKSRGYTLGEMFIPPRQVRVKEVYTTPLDYEVVRARQLRDGVANAAAALRADDAARADEARAAADALLASVERQVAAARAGGGSGVAAEHLASELKSALDALSRLHEQLIGSAVLEEANELDAIQAVRERAEALGRSSL